MKRYEIALLSSLCLAGCELGWEGRGQCVIHDDCADAWSCVKGSCRQLPPPELQSDEVTTRVGRPIVIDILANDAFDGPLVISGTLVGPEEWPHEDGGTYCPHGPGSPEEIEHGVFLFTPAPLEPGLDWQRQGFCYRVDYAAKERAVQEEVAVRVWRNEPPEASEQTHAVWWGQTVELTLAATDPNQPNENPLSFRVKDVPAHGTLGGEPPALTYTPEPGYVGQDAFTFVASDGDLDSQPATFNLIVTCAAPQDDGGITDWDTPLVLDVLENDGEPDAEVVWVGDAEHGSVTITPEGEVEYQAALGFLGQDTFRYRLERPDGCTAEAEVKVDVEWPVWLVPAGGPGSEVRAPSLSADGRFIAFSSDDPAAVAGDENGVADVFVWDRQANAVERVSVTTAGVESDGASFDPHISGDGRYVAFISTASNLAPGNTSGIGDVYLHDRDTGETELISAASGGGEADFESSSPQVSDDGRFVAFASVATNLISADGNGVRDVFVRDRDAGATERVNVAGDGSPADGPCDDRISMSADGARIAFACAAPSLGADGDLIADVFVRDRSESTTTLIASDGVKAYLSAGGRFVAVGKDAVTVVDLAAGTSDQVFNAGWEQYALSGDGRYLTYSYNGAVRVVDLVEDEEVEACVTRSGWVAPDPMCEAPAISADGRVLALESKNELVPGPSGTPRVYAARHVLAP